MTLPLNNSTSIWSLNQIFEPFITPIPQQTYAIPTLKGVSGRYIRIRPSLEYGDGYLTISQIQVIDVAGVNVARNKRVTATSTGGSPIDQQYGLAVMYDDVYTYIPGQSNNASIIVDGNMMPRIGLTNVFETSTPNNNPENQSLPDNQHVLIDLSNNYIIQKLIYTGRADAQKREIQNPDGSKVNINQVDRLRNMRWEILDNNSTLLTSGTFSDDPNSHIVTIELPQSLFTVGAGSNTLQNISIPNVDYYKKYTSAYRGNGINVINNNVSLIRKVNSFYTAVNTSQTTTTLQRTFDASGQIFSDLLQSSPIHFYKYIYKTAGCPSDFKYCLPNAGAASNALTGATATANAISAGLNSTLSISIFGSASIAALNEFTQSINLCNTIFLGSPSIVENYIRVMYSTTLSDIKAYIRSPSVGAGSNTFEDLISTNSRFCMPDLIQVFTNGAFKTQIATANQNWNTNTAQGNCTTQVTPSVLSLLPYSARNFLVQWIQERTVRYIRYTNTTTFETLTAASKTTSMMPTAVTARSQAQTSLQAFNAGFAPYVQETATMIQIPQYIDMTSPTLFDNIAQQFYEMLGGDYSISFIYDFLPLGTTMIDIRFDLVVHANSYESTGPLSDLKRQFDNITNLVGGNVSVNQDMYDQATIDYQEAVAKEEVNAIQNTLITLKGAVARIFYTNATAGSQAAAGPQLAGAITITGIIFDKKAVTSFITELNCGMNVPIGQQDGNINYAPKVEYILNAPINPIVCSEPGTIRRIMNDYTNMVTIDKNILLNKLPPLDTSKGTLFVESVSGATQVSPSQCVLQWNERLYDSITNRPTTSSSITRYGLFTYVKDTDNWYSPNYVYEPTAFKLLAAPNAGTILPACQFDPNYYKTSVGDRFNGLGSSGSSIQTLQKDFINNLFNNGKGDICPQTIPGYKFNTTDYVTANNAYIIANPTVISDLVANYKTRMASGENPIVRGPVSITALSSPIIYTKPLPSQSSLANASGLCPKVSCDDLDVLYSLVDQYNSDPSLPGVILHVSHAYTPNENQCDIKAKINYDANIQDIMGVTKNDPTTGIPVTTYPTIRKGTVTYSYNASKQLQQGLKAMPLTGVQETTMALYVAINKSDCSYNLGDASGQNSGYSIQPNTPQLYKPLIYIKELSKRSISGAGSSIGNIQANFAETGSKAKATLTSYRADTYAALGAINQPLSSCPGISCSDPYLQLRIMQYYTSQIPTVSMTQILKTGSLDGRSCDVTFRTNTNETRGARFTLGLQYGHCMPSGVVQPIIPTPSYDNIKDMTTPLSTANTIGSSRSGFTDYSPPFVNPNMDSKEYIIATEDAYPLKAHGFGLDRKRNSGPETAIHEKQFESPLKQEIPFVKMDTETQPTYKYIRFRPLRTRDTESEGVHIGKFTFYSGNDPVLFEGTVTNPMGTWEGNIKHVIGPGLRKGWYDAHKKSLIFAFKVPLIINGYSFHTAAPGKSTGNDPTAWKVEGSTTGTFWTTLNEQKKFPTPVERYKEIPIQAFYDTPL